MNKSRIFAILALIVFLASISAVAFAAPSFIEKARERFENAKEKFLEAKENWNESKNQWNDVRERYQNQKRVQDRNEFLGKAQNYLLKSTEHFIKYLEATKARAEKIENLEDADLNAITAQIDAEIAKLEALKTRIQGTDKNQLSTIAQEVKDEWDNAKAFSKKIVGLILAANTQKSINAAEKIALKAEERITALDQNAIDTNARQKLAEYRANVELAKQSKAQAVAKFLQISDSNNSRQFFKEGHDLLKQAHKQLRDAHKSFKDIIKEIVKVKKASKPEKPKDQNKSKDENESDENESD